MRFSLSISFTYFWFPSGFRPMGRRFPSGFRPISFRAIDELGNEQLPSGLKAG